MALELNGTTGVSLVQDGVVTAADLASGAITSAALPTGSVLQVEQGTKLDSFSTTSSSWTDITGLSVSITPSSTSSKILIACDFVVGSDAVGPDIMVRISRGGTAVAVANNGGTDNVSRHISNLLTGQPQYFIHPVAFQYLDSPTSTDALTYQVQIRNWSAVHNIKVGSRWVNNSFLNLSSITAMEIAG